MAYKLNTQISSLAVTTQVKSLIAAGDAEGLANLLATAEREGLDIREDIANAIHGNADASALVAEALGIAGFESGGVDIVNDFLGGHGFGGQEHGFGGQFGSFGPSAGLMGFGGTFGSDVVSLPGSGGAKGMGGMFGEGGLAGWVETGGPFSGGGTAGGNSSSFGGPNQGHLMDGPNGDSTVVVQHKENGDVVKTTSRTGSDGHDYTTTETWHGSGSYEMNRTTTNPNEDHDHSEYPPFNSGDEPKEEEKGTGGETTGGTGNETGGGDDTGNPDSTDTSGGTPPEEDEPDQKEGATSTTPPDEDGGSTPPPDIEEDEVGPGYGTTMPADDGSEGYVQYLPQDDGLDPLILTDPDAQPVVVDFSQAPPLGYGLTQPVLDGTDGPVEYAEEAPLDVDPMLMDDFGSGDFGF